MNELKGYRKKNIQMMRPYIPGENMDGVSVSEQDVLEEGGMIAVNESVDNDRWYIAKKFFVDNYELAEQENDE